MTKVAQLFEEEKIQYGREIAEKVAKDVTEKVTKSVTRNNELDFTKKMLRAGLSVKEVCDMMTVLTTQDVEKIAEKMALAPNRIRKKTEANLPIKQ